MNLAIGVPVWLEMPGSRLNGLTGVVAGFRSHHSPGSGIFRTPPDPGHCFVRVQLDARWVSGGALGGRRAYDVEDRHVRVLEGSRAHHSSR